MADVAPPEAVAVWAVPELGLVGVHVTSDCVIGHSASAAGDCQDTRRACDWPSTEDVVGAVGCASGCLRAWHNRCLLGRTPVSLRKSLASMMSRAAGRAALGLECQRTYALRLDAHLVIAGAGAEACPTPAALVASTVQV